MVWEPARVLCGADILLGRAHAKTDTRLRPIVVGKVWFRNAENCSVGSAAFSLGRAIVAESLTTIA